VGAIHGDDTIQAIAYLDVSERHTAGAGNGHGVLSPTVDDSLTDTLQCDAILPDHEGTADACEGDNRIGSLGMFNRGCERPDPAVHDWIRS
jgi:hypothetical protein